MISNQYKCIFVHIPKTGGSSVMEVLWPNTRTAKELYGLPNKYQTGGLQHLMAKHIKVEVSPEIFNSYFKFTIVRNPWDKAVSQFSYTKERRPDLLKLLNLSDKSSFKEYLCSIAEKNHVQWEEQYKFIIEEGGGVLVNFMCRFEQLKLDFKKVLLNLSLNPDLFELPHVNKTKRNHYSEYYDDESREMVAEKYKTDIEKFGYAFESKGCLSWISAGVVMGNEVMSAGQLLKQANQLKRAGRLDEAIDLYHQAIELSPNFSFNYYELGDAFHKTGNYAKAIIEYEKAIELNPNINFFHRSLELAKTSKNQLNINHNSNQSNVEFLVVGISMIKNEEDILETFVRHNLNYLDFLVLADNCSTDNSRIILKKLMQEGLNLCVIDDNKMAYCQSEKITNLYRRVATSFFPEFIVPIDADELIQSPSKQSFLNSLQAIPKQGVGLYPWKTYVPEPNTSYGALSDFKYRRKKEEPQYFKVILRSNGCVDWKLKISQGYHGLASSSSNVCSLKLPDVCLAHFPIRSLSQVFKKVLLGWLGYLERNKSANSQNQGYQWNQIYGRITSGENFYESDLANLALNYAQKVEVEAKDWSCNVELESPIIKSPPPYFSNLIVTNQNYTNVITTIVKSWENQIIKSPRLISREDLIPFTQSNSESFNNDNGVFNPDFHLKKLFVDIPPFKYVYERFLPKNVLDVGCGLGAYLKLFNKLGVEEIIGVDGFTPKQSFLRPDQYIRYDLTHPLDLQGKFDLVMCLEVAEHLPSGSEVNLIETLNNHASNILIFSAAEVGQPGNGHINCQPFEYWANLLANKGWFPMLAETLFLRCISSFSWFRRNLVLVEKKSEFTTSSKSFFCSWDKLIYISQMPYKWYSQESQIISDMLEVDIPDGVYPSAVESRL